MFDFSSQLPVEIPKAVGHLEEDPLTNIDFILPPPPEFQEESDKNQTNITVANEINTEQDIIEKTLSEHIKLGSLTPDFLSPPRLCSQNILKRANAMGTSTPFSDRMHSVKSLSISPIGFERDKNLFEAVKNVKNSPLTVVNTPPPPVVVDKKIPEHCANPKQQQSILNYIRPATQETVTQKKPCVTCSRLGKEHMIAVSSLANKKLAIYTSTFGPTVTHVVVAVNEKNCVKDHTMKYVCAVAAGIWVVSFKWVQDCLAHNRIVPEVS